MNILWTHIVLINVLMICNKTKVLGKRPGSSLSLSVVRFRAALAGIWFSVNVRLPVAALLGGGGSPPAIVFGRLRIKAHVSRKNTLNLCFPPHPPHPQRAPAPFSLHKQSAATKVCKWDQPEDLCPRCCSVCFIFQGNHQIHEHLLPPRRASVWYRKQTRAKSAFGDLSSSDSFRL